MKNSNELFKQGIRDAFKDVNINPETIKDANKHIGNFNEERENKKNKKNKIFSFDDIVKRHSKKEGPNPALEKLIKSQLTKGIKVEMEHTDDKKIARKIAMDHLHEDPRYYDKLKKMESGKNKSETKEATSTGGSGQYSKNLFSEKQSKKVETKEATTSGSVGSYETPSFLAKSSNKKDWRGKSKPQIPGGKFVSIKKKCKKFPYCNQGDIKALNLYEKEYVKEAINNLSKKMNLSENTIKAIIQFELEEMKKINNK
jgi:hypothetical protein